MKVMVVALDARASTGGIYGHRKVCRASEEARVVYDRRTALAALGAAAAWPILAGSAGAAEAGPFSPTKGARSRVLMVNDLAGDFDGLIAAAHAVLSRSIDLRGLIASGAVGLQGSTTRAMELGGELLRVMRAERRVPLIQGANERLATMQPVRSAGTQRIIEEAMRSDTRLPLYIAVGGGLTEVASAVMLQPLIAKKMTLVWIGGGSTGEYNYLIDPLAARYIFNETEVSIWQVPEEAYATCQVSMTELQAFVAPYGATGAWLYKQALRGIDEFSKRFPINTGEIWSMGDSPLVLLTALSDFANRRAANVYDSVFTPVLNERGVALPREAGRKLRYYTKLDTRLMLSDFYAKLKVNTEME